MTEKLRVFVCHANEDHLIVDELVKKLRRVYDADYWVDNKKIKPGQDWEKEILDALDLSDAVIVCLSCNSVNKEGYVQKELRLVLDLESKKPKGTIFLIPVRLNPCTVPRDLERIQWEDYFPEAAKQDAIDRLALSLKDRARTIRKRQNSKNGVGKFRRAVEIVKESEQDKKVQPRKPLFNLAWVGVIFIMILLIIAVTALGLPGIKDYFGSTQNSPLFPGLTPEMTPPQPTDQGNTVDSSDTNENEPTVITEMPAEIPLPDIGIMHNCISSLWQPFPTTPVSADDRNCLQEPVYGIATTDGSLSLRTYKAVTRATLYGLITPLSNDAEISLNLRFNSEFIQSQFWVGVVDGGDPTVSSIMVIYTDKGNYIRVIGPNCYGDCYLYQNNDEPLQQSNPGFLQLELTPNSISIPINYSYTYDRGINYSQPTFFIGYLLLPGTQNPDLNVVISDMKITVK